MSFEQAFDAALAGQLILVVDRGTTPTEIAADWSARALDALDLLPAAAGSLTAGERMVVGNAEALAGLVAGAGCGPWDLTAAIESLQPAGVVLHTACDHPAVVTQLCRHLDLLVIGGVEADSPPEDGGGVTTDAVAEVLGLARQSPWLSTTVERADLLHALAVCGHLHAVRRTPFLVEVADDRRFKRPFVEAEPRMAAFFERYDEHVGQLGMLESARYRFHGRQPRDLRPLATALELPLHEVVAVCRVMDRQAVMVSVAQDEGAASGRCNLAVEIGPGDIDLCVAAVDVGALLEVRRKLGLSFAAAEVEQEAADREADLPSMAGLFASLSTVAVEPAADEYPAVDPAQASRAPRPRKAPPVPEELPSHLPGLAALAAGDLATARAALAGVEGEARDEALLLAAFRYEVIDADGNTTRRFEIPAKLQTVARRALELEGVPSSRLRAVLDEAFPDVFVEVPRPGLIEAFYGSGELAGTHRLRELPGRGLFERPHLEGVRAVQARLARGEAVEGDAGDEGWERLAEALRLRDAGEAEQAWQLLADVDVHVELDEIRRDLIAELPPDHPERVELERQAADERLRRALGPVKERMEQALQERGGRDGAGYEAVAMARENGVVTPLLGYLTQAADDDPDDPGPPLWIARIRAEDGDLVAAEVAYGRAVQRVRSDSHAAEWSAELAERALRIGDADLWWRCLKRLLKMDANPRALDSFLLRLVREGALGGDDLEPLVKLLKRHGGRKQFPGTYRKLEVQDEMDPWKKVLQALKVDE